MAKAPPKRKGKARRMAPPPRPARKSKVAPPRRRTRTPPPPPPPAAEAVQKTSRIILPKSIDSSDLTVDIPRPPGWARDTLTEFLEHAYRNRLATFVHATPWAERLSDIDARFMKIAKPGGPEQTEIAWINPPDPVTPLMFMRCLAAFRAACEHAMSGQVSEVYPQVRSCLEYAGYALLMRNDGALITTWLSRHNDAASRKVVAKSFSFGNMKTAVNTASRENGKVFEQLYETAVDMGAHPNERAITGNLSMFEKDGNKVFMQAFLNTEPLALVHALKTVARTGVCALGIFVHVFQARAMLLNVESDLPKLRSGL